MKQLILILFVIVGGLYYVNQNPDERDRIEGYYQGISSQLKLDSIIDSSSDDLIQQDKQVTITFVSRQTSKPFKNSDLKVEITNTSEIINKTSFVYNTMTNDFGKVTFALKTDVSYNIKTSEGIGRAQVYSSNQVFVVQDEKEYILEVDERALFKPTVLSHKFYSVKNDEEVEVPTFTGREIWEFEVSSLSNGIINCPSIKLVYDDAVPHIWKKSSRNVNLPEPSERFPNDVWQQLSGILYPNDYAVLMLQFDEAKVGKTSLIIDDLCGQVGGNEHMNFTLSFVE